MGLARGGQREFDHEFLDGHGLAKEGVHASLRANTVWPILDSHEPQRHEAWALVYLTTESRNAGHQWLWVGNFGAVEIEIGALERVISIWSPGSDIDLSSLEGSDNFHVPPANPAICHKMANFPTFGLQALYAFRFWE